MSVVIRRLYSTEILNSVCMESPIPVNSAWESNLRTTHLLELCYVFCFSPSGFKYFRTLVANIRATNFLGSFFLRKCMLPTVVLINKVRSALRAHLTKKAVFRAYYTSNTLILKSYFKPKTAFVNTATDALMLYMKTWKNILRSFTEHNP